MQTTFLNKNNNFKFLLCHFKFLFRVLGYTKIEFLISSLLVLNRQVFEVIISGV